MGNIFKLCLLLIAFLFPLPAFGDTEASPRSYSKPSSNSKFVFVMIATIEIENDGIAYGDKGKKEAQRIRAKYQKSGMYLNGGSNIPLWTVDWYSHSVLVASDGIHLIREGPWASSLSDEAFTFFANGKELRSYKVGDLVDTSIFLPHSVFHFEWKENMNLDDERKILLVTTLSREKYVFDYATGETISANRPIRVILGICLSVLFFITFLVIKQRRLFARTAV